MGAEKRPIRLGHHREVATARGDHVGQEGAGEGEGAEVVDLHHGAVHFGGRVDQAAPLADATAVNHYVHTSGVLPDLGNQCVKAIGCGQIERGEVGVVRADFRSHGFEALQLAGGEDEAVTALVASARHRLADARGGT